MPIRTTASDSTHLGRQLALDMMKTLEDNDDEPLSLCDLAELGYDRQGRPLYNPVLEYLQRARLIGQEAESGFCSVLSTLAAISACGAGAGHEELVSAVEKEIAVVQS